MTRPSTRGAATKVAALLAALFAASCLHHDLDFLPWDSEGGRGDATADGGDPPSGCLDARGASRCTATQACITYYFAGGPRQECLERCTPGSTTCAPGRVCGRLLDTPDRGYCRLECGGDEDCRTGSTCDRSSHLCVCSSDEACASAFDNERYGCNPTTRTCGPRCSVNEDCRCGSVCAAGYCTPGCAVDADCCGAQRCAAGQCTGPAPANLPLESRCGSGSDCASGAVCDGVVARGECTPDPGPSCEESSCPSGWACTYYRDIDGRLLRGCQRTCAEGATCGPNLACGPDITDETRRVCLPRCWRNEQCAAGATCERASGLCRCTTDESCQEYGATNGRCDAATGQCHCARSCDGRTCGPDGCGGSCGSCGEGTICRTATGRCEPPFCGGDNFTVRCADGSGTCPSHSRCASGGCTCEAGYVAQTCAGAACDQQEGGQCTAPSWWCRACTPSCDGAQCGDDGCGGSCGGCAEGERCTAARRCVAPTPCTPNCSRGCFTPDGCGNRCPGCPEGLMCTQVGIDNPVGTCGPCACVMGTCDSEGRCVERGGTGGCTCAGRMCGANSCGTGSCGTCAAGTTCDSGTCVRASSTPPTTSCPSGQLAVSWNGAAPVCSPICSTNAQCASGMCNQLSSGQRACYPGSGGGGSGGCSCAGRACGRNSCGAGSCGSCPSGRTCDASGQCVGGTTTTASCTDLTSCVSMTNRHPTSSGSCAGEVTGTLTNNCGRAAYCQFGVRDGGTTSSRGGTRVGAGASVGGELGGIWSCGHSASAGYVYRCSAAENDHSCSNF